MTDPAETISQNYFTTKAVITPVLSSLLLLLAILALPAETTAQTDRAKTASGDFNKWEEPVEVMVLGTFHFTGAPDFNAIDAPEQQEEIREMVQDLASFNPDKIALEYVRSEKEKLDSLYNAYLQGTHELTVNERQQIGFRLGKMLGHKNVYSIDYKKPWGMRATFNWAKEHAPGFIDYFRRWKEEMNHTDSLLHSRYTIGEILSYYSRESFLDRIQQFRMRSLEVGAGKNYTGVDPVASVYKRNLRIFANLAEIAEPGDRILIVYGSGHSWYFHNFIEDHPHMKLADLGKFLEAKNIELSQLNK